MKEQNEHDLVSVRYRDGRLRISPQLLPVALGSLEGLFTQMESKEECLGKMLGSVLDMINWMYMWGI